MNSVEREAKSEESDPPSLYYGVTSRTQINTDDADLPREILKSRNSKAVISQGEH